MPNIERLIEEPTLERLTRTKAKMKAQGWKPIGSPVKSEAGYSQLIQRYCCLC
ncbi:hypothetical protein RUM4293_00433 [Ruegeria atlantica]|uniref:Uncharacterized protein n=1 Tax=Ruegeria atlantica TaxID=81569 RepID=A0A0P1E160_9RHOB|nr:hypothetical protein RUM4293_00433 [Ruegeria atlantica]